MPLVYNCLLMVTCLLLLAIKSVFAKQPVFTIHNCHRILIPTNICVINKYVPLCLDSTYVCAIIIPAPTKHVELEPLYSNLVKVINDGLVAFEKSSSLHLSSLQCTIMLLKAACTNNSSYVDRWVSHDKPHLPMCPVSLSGILWTYICIFINCIS